MLLPSLPLRRAALPSRRVTIPEPVPRHAPLAAFVLVNLPVLHWLAQRTTDGSDEPLGLLALAAVVFFLFRARRESSLRPAVLAAGTVVVTVLQILLRGSMPLVVAAASMALLAASLSMHRGKAGVMLLLIMSLPWLASLDFYAGYPLRLGTACLSDILLSHAGVDVGREGVLLRHHGVLVGVDPPCAGIHMLWTGVFVAAVLASRASLSTAGTLWLALAAILGVVLGNLLRAVVLFFPEAGLVHWPRWTHEAAGLLICGMVLLGLMKLAGWLRGAQAVPITVSTAQAQQGTNFIPASVASAGALAFACWVLFAAPAPATAGSSASDAPAWPATLDGVPLEPLPLTPKEALFARSFPGALARFRCGDAEVILRKVTHATRKLHSSADCLRAAGCRVEPQAVFRDRDGRTWGRFEASSFTGIHEVSERITPLRHGGPEFTDVSAWFWHALLHEDEGPWMAVTVMRRRGGGN